MDRNFHTDDFERLLKEKSDEFMMYPSKRIWYSIYNNIHPGNKWPSVAMCISLISALLLIGYLNTRNTNQYSGIVKNKLQQKLAINSKSVPNNTSTNDISIGFLTQPATNSKTIEQASIPVATTVIKNSKTQINSTQLLSNSPIDFSNTPTTSLIAAINANYDFSDFQQFNKDNSTVIDAINHPLGNLIGNNPDFSKNNKIAVYDFGAENFDSEQITSITNPEASYSTVQSTNQSDIQTKISIKAIAPEIKELMLEAYKKDIISADDQEWINNFALYNRPAPKLASS